MTHFELIQQVAAFLEQQDSRENYSVNAKFEVKPNNGPEPIKITFCIDYCGKYSFGETPEAVFADFQAKFFTVAKREPLEARSIAAMLDVHLAGACPTVESLEHAKA